MYQTCPICNGTGFEVPPIDSPNASATQCSVCRGAKIIHKDFGTPPMGHNVGIDPYEEDRLG